MYKLGVFLSANTLNNEIFDLQTVAFGQELARRQYHLIFGGSDAGLMRSLANSVLCHGGQATGISTPGLSHVKHQGLSGWIEKKDLAERKKEIITRSDMLIALPGGIGTLDELFAAWALMKAKEIAVKPIGLLNINGIYSDLYSYLLKLRQQGFLTQNDLDMLIIENNTKSLLAALEKRCKAM